MRYRILAAVTWCTVAGLALADNTTQKKAVAPSTKTAVKTAAPKTAVATPPKTAPKTAVKAASKTAVKTPPKTAATTAAKNAPTGKLSPARTTASRSTATKSRYTTNYRQRQPVRRYTAQQASPTADRYREIQDALAAKGYLKTPSTGVWDKDSMDAMQRFQTDKNLEPTGKLTAGVSASWG